MFFMKLFNFDGVVTYVDTYRYKNVFIYFIGS